MKIIEVFSNRKEYLVRWSGLDEEGDPWIDTWEPERNIEPDCEFCSERMTRFIQERNSCLQNGVPFEDTIKKLSRVVTARYYRLEE